MNAQDEQRELERAVRKQAVAYARCCKQGGRNAADVAAELRLPEGTLSHWKGQWRKKRLPAAGRGRRLQRPDVAVRNRIFETLLLWGPRLSIAALKTDFSGVARRELEDFQRRFRVWIRRRKKRHCSVLSWGFAGAVWAMDFLEPPNPIDGVYKFVLAVRDLSSGNLLWSQAVEHKDAPGVLDALKALFIAYGAPLVIKSDNEGAFSAPEVAALLKAFGVKILLSPPYTPEYNGACEAGIGSLKYRAHEIAARNGRPGQWTCDDLEAARLLANEMSRPQGLNGPSPKTAWEGRQRVSDALRLSFNETYIRLEKEARVELGFPPDKDPDPASQAKIDRVAIPRALVAHDLLFFRRRRISPPIKARFWRKIS